MREKEEWFSGVRAIQRMPGGNSIQSDWTRLTPTATEQLFEEARIALKQLPGSPYTVDGLMFLVGPQAGRWLVRDAILCGGRMIDITWRRVGEECPADERPTHRFFDWCLESPWNPFDTSLDEKVERASRRPASDRDPSRSAGAAHAARRKRQRLGHLPTGQGKYEFAQLTLAQHVDVESTVLRFQRDASAAAQALGKQFDLAIPSCVQLVEEGDRREARVVWRSSQLRLASEHQEEVDLALGLTDDSDIQGAFYELNAYANDFSSLIDQVPNEEDEDDSN